MRHSMDGHRRLCHVCEGIAFEGTLYVLGGQRLHIFVLNNIHIFDLNISVEGFVAPWFSQFQDRSEKVSSLIRFARIIILRAILDYVW